MRCWDRYFGLVAARQYSRAIAQDHQALGIIFYSGFVERPRRSKTVVRHEYSLNAGALAAIAEQFNPVLAFHAIILAKAVPRVHPGETRRWAGLKRRRRS